MKFCQNNLLFCFGYRGRPTFGLSQSAGYWRKMQGLSVEILLQSADKDLSSFYLYWVRRKQE